MREILREGDEPHVEPLVARARRAGERKGGARQQGGLRQRLCEAPRRGAAQVPPTPRRRDIEAMAIGAREPSREQRGVARLPIDARRGMGEAARQAVEPLHRRLEQTQLRAPPARDDRGEMAQDARTVRGDERRSGGGRRRTRIGDEIADREIRFVADAGDDRKRGIEDRLRDDSPR